MYRQFYLKNGLGQSYSLTDQSTKVFLSSPSGLGFKKDIEMERLGNTYKFISEEYDIPKVSGELMFLNNLENAYQDYFDFTDFISVKPIYLYYIPANANNKQYYIECEITKLDKTEYSNTEKCLKCPITFEGKHFWKNDVPIEIKAYKEFASGVGKYYDPNPTGENDPMLQRPYYYSGNSLKDIVFYNNSNANVGFIFEIVGSVNNPEFKVYNTGKMYGSCKITGLYTYTKIDSVDGEESLYLEKNGVEVSNPNIYQDLDYLGDDVYLTFIKLKPGENRIAFNCANIDTFDGYVKILFYEEYATV